MLIGGLQKLSLIDYPDKIAAIVFTIGCNFRCPFCYNPELVGIGEISKISKIGKDIEIKLISEEEVFDFLRKRKKVLDAVVITGGEPTLQPDLAEFIKKIKQMGYLVKLDSNGTNPLILQKLIKAGLVDYIAMDIKAPLSKYEKAVRMKVNVADIRKSIKIIMNSGLGYEFRSTLVPGLHSIEDIRAMAKMIKGANKYYLQKFVPAKKMIDIELRKVKPFSDREMKEMAGAAKERVGKLEIRN